MNDTIQRHGATGRQAVLSCAVMAAASMTIWLPNVFMDTFDHAFQQRRHDAWLQANFIFYSNHFYENPNLHTVIDVLPRTDFRQGGVYLLGASTTDIAINPYDQLRLSQHGIHNLCQTAQTFTEEYQFVRLLIDHDGLAQPGPPRNALVIGLCFADMNHRKTLDNDLWEYPYIASGLFHYDVATGLDPIAMPDIDRDLRLEFFRARFFWGWVRDYAEHWANARLPRQHRIDSPPEPGADRWSRTFGPDWQAGADLEMRALSDLIALLDAHHVPCRFIYLPERPWTRSAAIPKYYHDSVCALMTTKHATMIDLRDLLPDDAYYIDSVHYHRTGSLILAPVVEKAATDLKASLAP